MREGAKIVGITAEFASDEFAARKRLCRIEERMT
jgi:hypothetical protein